MLVLYHLEVDGATPMYWFYHAPLLSHLLGVAPSTFNMVYPIGEVSYVPVRKIIHSQLHSTRLVVYLATFADLTIQISLLHSVEVATNLPHASG